MTPFPPPSSSSGGWSASGPEVMQSGLGVLQSLPVLREHLGRMPSNYTLHSARGPVLILVVLQKRKWPCPRSGLHLPPQTAGYRKQFRNEGVGLGGEVLTVPITHKEWKRQGQTWNEHINFFLTSKRKGNHFSILCPSLRTSENTPPSLFSSQGFSGVCNLSRSFWLSDEIYEPLPRMVYKRLQRRLIILKYLYFSG